jgi:hypothetical protein
MSYKAKGITKKSKHVSRVKLHKEACMKEKKCFKEKVESMKLEVKGRSIPIPDEVSTIMKDI